MIPILLFFILYNIEDSECYSLKPLRIDVTYVNYDFVENFRCYIIKYNRTHPAINADLKTKVDLLENGKTRLILDIYMFNGNAWAKGGMKGSIDFCKGLRLPYPGRQSISNMKTCPVAKGTYWLRNFNPSIPGYQEVIYRTGKFLAKITMTQNDTVLWSMDYYEEITKAIGEKDQKHNALIEGLYSYFVRQDN